MPESPLEKLLARKNTSLKATLDQIIALAGKPVGIYDPAGRLLWGHALSNPRHRHPIEHESTALGYVAGDIGSDAVAAFLNYAVQSELEKRLLSSEILDNYRELNVIYGISKKVASFFKLESMADSVFQAVQRLIQASGGAILLHEPETGRLVTAATFGESHVEPCRLIAQDVMRVGKAEILNDAPSDPRYLPDDTRIHALVCAPLRAGGKMTGVILLVSTEACTYTAADLKLLSAVALQVAPAFDYVRAYQRELQAIDQDETGWRV